MNEKSSHAEREERILSFWKENSIFEASIDKDAPQGDYTVYDGPPFATGLPHYGHIVPSTIKDVIPRFKTMQGYRVRRRWGWDCHGLPVENLIEKELGLKSKKDIIDYGTGNFNKKAQESVLRYADEWRKIVPRLGRWVDMEHDYRTMDASYTESVWWIFKQLYGKGLIYEGFKSMNLCPHCGTTLSNFEVAQGYKDITDISVYVKFKIKNQKHVLDHDRGLKIKNESQDTYILAWTTTPWTLPGNVALAVNRDIEYVKVRINITSAVIPVQTVIQDGEHHNEKNSKHAKKSVIHNSDASTESSSLDPVLRRGDSTGNNDNDGNFFIFAKSRLSVLKDKKYEILETFKGSDLVGVSYEPLFDYYSKDAKLKNRENGWKIYGGDFVTTEHGTGVVHIAPAFGADDYALSLTHKLPFVQHVASDGTFKTEIKDFSGSVKPRDTAEDKNAHQKADISIIKWLAHNGHLFEKEKLVHSYPHCWRCDTPLLNYAASSWFVKVTDLKEKLISENNKITWVPPEIGSARFGNWLEGARDWAISRSRFWGAPIPVWKEVKSLSSTTIGDQKHVLDHDRGSNIKIETLEKYHVVGSIDDLRKYSKSKNKYWVMRHGESKSNVLGILSGDPHAPHHLTDKGMRQVETAAHNLKGQHFDMVFMSPFLRTQETASVLKKVFGWNDDMLKTDDRLKELDSGVWNGKPLADFISHFPSNKRFLLRPEGGENYTDIKKRMGEFLYEIDKKYEGKNILIVTHETPALLLMSVAQGLSQEQTLALRKTKYDIIANAEVLQLHFTPLPHNAEYELDLHRPYIDDIELRTPEGVLLERVPDVFDCWFESGSMPYGENHYPFSEKESFDPKAGLFHKSKGYPADFISEGLDQTRGWFYSMLVLGVALFGTTPYKKVIVNGLVLAEDGQKMSKSKKNFPDPMVVVEKYGADALRYYLVSSPVVRGQDLKFSEKGVDEITKKLVNRLLNVVSFYELYGTQSTHASNAHSKNILDQWMITRLNETIQQVSDGLEAGELDRATRPLMDIVDDLSTWYLRRSRDRFKLTLDSDGGDEGNKDKLAALETTGYVLISIAQLLAPFMPFLAEEIYQKVSAISKKDSPTITSVHLESWPVSGDIDTKILTSMRFVRQVTSEGLEGRMNAKINVRQPLRKLKIKDQKLKIDNVFLALIKDEVNVKEVVFDASIETDVELDTHITPELKEEGTVRELIRVIQDFRKEKGLSVSDAAALTIDTDDIGQELITKNKAHLMSVCTLSELLFDTIQGEYMVVGDISVKVFL